MNESRATRGPNWGLLLLIPAAVIVAKGAMRRRAMWDAAWATDPGSAGHPSGHGHHGRFAAGRGQGISQPRSGCRRRSSGCSTRGTPVRMSPARRPMRRRRPTRRTPASPRPSESASLRPGGLDLRGQRQVTLEPGRHDPGELREQRLVHGREVEAGLALLPAAEARRERLVQVRRTRRPASGTGSRSACRAGSLRRSPTACPRGRGSRG